MIGYAAGYLQYTVGVLSGHAVNLPKVKKSIVTMIAFEMSEPVHLQLPPGILSYLLYNTKAGGIAMPPDSTRASTEFQQKMVKLPSDDTIVVISGSYVLIWAPLRHAVVIWSR